EDRPGLTHVALGRVRLDEAIVSFSDLAYEDADGNAGDEVSSNGHAALQGVLEVLPAGALPPNPGEFVASRAVGDIFAQLRRRAARSSGASGGPGRLPRAARAPPPGRRRREDERDHRAPPGSAGHAAPRLARPARAARRRRRRAVDGVLRRRAAVLDGGDAAD